jgi:hypothetical protein
MNNHDALLVGVMAEVAYRTEELHKAGRSVWVDRARKASKRLRAGRADVHVPEQRRESGEVPATSAKSAR